MNDALPVRWLALTHPLTTALSGPTRIPVMEGPAAVAAEPETNRAAEPVTQGVSEAETDRPAPAVVKAKRPVSAAVLTSLRDPTVPPLSPEYWHLWHDL
jgi:hypothetical protein